jgi:hypothetical protein
MTIGIFSHIVHYNKNVIEKLMVDFQKNSIKIANHVIVDFLNKVMIDFYLLMPLGFNHVISFSIVKNNLDLKQLTYE